MKRDLITEMPPRPKLQIPKSLGNTHPLTGEPDPVITCTEEGARQEFKADANIEHILRSHLGIPPNGKLPLPGHPFIDFDMNLQDGLNAVAEANRAWLRIPEPFRTRFVSWEGIQNALADGVIIIKDGHFELKTEEPPKPPQPAKA